MITAEIDGNRFVVVGKRVMQSRNWRYFTDFLIENLKFVLGHDWGRTASKQMPDFPIFRWLQLLQDAKRTDPADHRLPNLGFVRAAFRLAYAIYLIEHNDALPRNMLKRMKHPNTFDAHCYEAIVASAFALAGATIKGAEDERGNAPKPEFYATFTGGKRYAVEAKRKASWKNAFSKGGADFEGELRSWIRDKIFAASKKQLENPVYWFELAIGQQLDQEDIQYLRDMIGAAIKSGEEITIKGQLAEPAYIVVTNNPEFATDEVIGIGFHLFQGFRMDDFREGYVDIETAMAWHDKHRSVRRVLECIEEVQQLPASFAGVPNELLDMQGEPVAVPQIGDRFDYPGPEGNKLFGTILDIVPADDKAWVVVSNEVIGATHIISMPLTDQESKAVDKYGPMIFGKPENRQQRNITDPLDFYDRMLEIYSNYPRESLLNQVRSHRDFQEFEKLSDAALHIRVAREITKSVEFRSKSDSSNGAGQTEDGHATTEISRI